MNSITINPTTMVNDAPQPRMIPYVQYHRLSMAVCRMFNCILRFHSSWMAYGESYDQTYTENYYTHGEHQL